MKKLFMFFLFYFFFFGQLIYSQTGWFVQQSGITKNLKSVYFVNAQTGWAVGDSGKIIKTINGGSNWILQNSNTNLHLNAVKFYNEQTGWAVGGWTNMSYAYAIIVNTVNGGNTWNIQPNPDSYTNIIYDISIFDANNVMIASGGTSFQGFSLGGFISKTTNGGINWFTILGNYNYGPDAFTSLSFINSSTGWAGVLNQSDVGPGILKIYKTTNMGNNWGVLDSNTVQTNVNPTNTLQKVQFINNTTGYIYGKYYLKKTTSGGANWTKLDSATTTNGNDYYFVNKDTGWIVKPTGIIRTNNGGANWALQNSPLTGLRKIFFINSLTGWAVGNNGGIVKTVSGGYLLPSDTESAKYFPMHIGNLYTYYWYEIGPYGSSGYFKARITKDTIMNGYRYYYLNNFPDIGTGWVRYDSSRSNLLAYYPNANCSGYINDKIIDSLKMSINDQITTCVYHWTWLLCQDTTSISIFNNTVSSKGFRHDGLMLAYTRYAKNFGIISYNYGEPPPSTYFSLIRGCKINEIVYGDTNIYYTVSGNARYSDNNQPVTSGTIKAFKLDKNTANIIVFDTAVIQSNGSYTLPNVPQDSVDIGVFPNSTPPNDYVITYYPSTIYWEHATTLYPTGNLTNINIGAIRMSSSTNSNSVNGKVMRLNDNPLGNLKDAVLYAKNGNTFVRCAVSDGNGIYHLQSLPTGNLKILATRLGFSRDSVNVNVTSTSNIDSINFYLYRLYVGIKQINSTIPSEYRLFQNYPNPFNPSTNIRYQITNNGFVSLKVFDALGREIETLVNEKQPEGTYEAIFDGRNLPSGIYFYRLQTDNFTETKRMVFLK